MKTYKGLKAEEQLEILELVNEINKGNPRTYEEAMNQLHEIYDKTENANVIRYINHLYCEKFKDIIKLPVQEPAYRDPFSNLYFSHYTTNITPQQQDPKLAAVIYEFGIICEGAGFMNETTPSNEYDKYLKTHKETPFPLYEYASKDEDNSSLEDLDSMIIKDAGRTAKRICEEKYKELLSSGNIEAIKKFNEDIDIVPRHQIYQPAIKDDDDISYNEEN